MTASGAFCVEELRIGKCASRLRRGSFLGSRSGFPRKRENVHFLTHHIPKTI